MKIHTIKKKIQNSVHLRLKPKIIFNRAERFRNYIRVGLGVAFLIFTSIPSFAQEPLQKFNLWFSLDGQYRSRNLSNFAFNRYEGNEVDGLLAYMNINVVPVPPLLIEPPNNTIDTYGQAYRDHYNLDGNLNQVRISNTDDDYSYLFIRTRFSLAQGGHNLLSRTTFTNGGRSTQNDVAFFDNLYEGNEDFDGHPLLPYMAGNMGGLENPGYDVTVQNNAPILNFFTDNFDDEVPDLYDNQVPIMLQPGLMWGLNEEGNMEWTNMEGLVRMENYSGETWTFVVYRGGNSIQAISYSIPELVPNPDLNIENTVDENEEDSIMELFDIAENAEYNMNNGPACNDRFDSSNFDFGNERRLGEYISHDGSTQNKHVFLSGNFKRNLSQSITITTSCPTMESDYQIYFSDISKSESINDSVSYTIKVFQEREDAEDVLLEELEISLSENISFSDERIVLSDIAGKIRITVEMNGISEEEVTTEDRYKLLIRKLVDNPKYGEAKFLGRNSVSVNVSNGGDLDAPHPENIPKRFIKAEKLRKIMNLATITDENNDEKIVVRSDIPDVKEESNLNIKKYYIKKIHSTSEIILDGKNKNFTFVRIDDKGKLIESVVVPEWKSWSQWPHLTNSQASLEWYFGNYNGTGNFISGNLNGTLSLSDKKTFPRYVTLEGEDSETGQKFTKFSFDAGSFRHFGPIPFNTSFSTSGHNGEKWYFIRNDHGEILWGEELSIPKVIEGSFYFDRNEDPGPLFTTTYIDAVGSSDAWVDVNPELGRTPSRSSAELYQKKREIEFSEKADVFNKVRTYILELKKNQSLEFQISLKDIPEELKPGETLRVKVSELNNNGWWEDLFTYDHHNHNGVNTMNSPTISSSKRKVRIKIATLRYLSSYFGSKPYEYKFYIREKLSTNQGNTEE